MPVDRFQESIEQIRTILYLQGKCSETGSCTKRDKAELRRAVASLEVLLGVFIILDGDRMEVNRGYETIRAVKAIHDLPEFSGENTSADRLFGLMKKIFYFRKLSDRSIRNYYYRGKEE